MRRCLEKNPDERFQTAKDVAFALEAEGGVGPTAVSAAPAAFRRWRSGALAAALLVAGGSVAAVSVLWLRPPAVPHVTAIRQVTPHRVASRRGADAVRMKRVIASQWLGPFEGGGHLWEVRTESGTYVKELISGDGGRTAPSLAAVLGAPCRCAALDVLEVHWTPPWEERTGTA